VPKWPSITGGAPRRGRERHRRRRGPRSTREPRQPTRPIREAARRQAQQVPRQSGRHLRDRTRSSTCPIRSRQRRSGARPRRKCDEGQSCLCVGRRRVGSSRRQNADLDHVRMHRMGEAEAGKDAKAQAMHPRRDGCRTVAPLFGSLFLPRCGLPMTPAAQQARYNFGALRHRAFRQEWTRVASEALKLAVWRPCQFIPASGARTACFLTLPCVQPPPHAVPVRVAQARAIGLRAHAVHTKRGAGA
jgi:hypothetical protein